ncbi:hypothetical protein [Chondromyces apiculatus]|uniref:S1 RNA binding domain protein n=1 Tax=Chondromyces apiculatus DSM 436 TaxID=1192034 RepID=A0A017T7D8_9BACT|nr:hypothetical protein [Chondromyces apiculatus]EYF05168.1 S1 RNA binding domain protein [Chondromyces apiculatus DSM 436]
MAFLKVTGVTSFGAFVAWGQPKDLLVPRAEQTRAMRPGERHPIGLFIDREGRPTGTMRVSEMLRGTRSFMLDEWVQGEAWRKDPDIGVFVIVERRYVGLVPADEPNDLARGEAEEFRVANILDDGKVELSLRGFAHEEVEDDAEDILEVLAKKSTPRVGDRSPSEQIRALFGMSKKAFKRAVGRLLKEQRVAIDDDGFVVVLR